MRNFHNISELSTNVASTETLICCDNITSSTFSISGSHSFSKSLSLIGKEKIWLQMFLALTVLPTHDSFLPLLLPLVTGHTPISDDFDHTYPIPFLFLLT